MNQKTVSANEYNNVTNIVAKYVEAIRIGDIDMLADIFHEKAIACGTVNGEFVGGSGSNPAADFIKQNGKSPEIVFCVDVLDITPTTAIVRLVMEKDAIGAECNAYLTLVKLGGDWSVIAKVFHQF